MGTGVHASPALAGAPLRRRRQFSPAQVLVVSFAALIASGAILYDTSNVLHKYRTEQYVAAALALFASVGILFWYILQIVISMSNRR